MKGISKPSDEACCSPAESQESRQECPHHSFYEEGFKNELQSYESEKFESVE